MNIHPIHNEADYQKALKRVEELMDAEENTEAGDELDVLSTLICAYEEKTYPIEAPDPIEAIRSRMDQMSLTPKQLGEMVATRPNRIYEILNKSRPLTLAMIRKLSATLKISPRALVQEYPLGSQKKHGHVKTEVHV